MRTVLEPLCCRWELGVRGGELCVGTGPAGGPRSPGAAPMGVLLVAVELDVTQGAAGGQVR